MKEQTRKEMQQKMAEYQMAIPEVSWSEIEQTVSAQRQIASTKKQHAVIAPLWRKRIAAAVAIITIGGASIWMLRYQGQTESLQVKTEKQRVEQSITDSKDVKVSDTPILAELSEKTTAKPTAYASAVSHTYIQEENNVKNEDGMSVQKNTQEDNHTQTSEQSTRLQHSSAVATYTPSNSTPTTNPSTTNTRLTAKIYFGNSINNYTSNTMFATMLMNANPFGKYDDEMSYEGDSPLNSNLTELKTSVHHHQPLRFGLSLRYDISSRWSVESGLSYSHHKSDITNLSGDHETITEQQLSYIGIPLNVGYRIWDHHRFSFYASAGAIVEKMVKGSRTTQGVTENVSIHPLQFSLNTSVGAEIFIDKAFSFYAEPGLSYHFDNNSNIPTIYQDEPLNLNLNIGLRFSFK